MISDNIGAERSQATKALRERHVCFLDPPDAYFVVEDQPAVGRIGCCMCEGVIVSKAHQIASVIGWQMPEPDRLDSFYFALGTLTTAGTGNISAISALSRGLQSWQMGIDLVLIGFVAALILARYASLFDRSRTADSDDNQAKLLTVVAETVKLVSERVPLVSQTTTTAEPTADEISGPSGGTAEADPCQRANRMTSIRSDRVNEAKQLGLPVSHVDREVLRRTDTNAKDAVEDALNHAVCDGQITLRVAQIEIAGTGPKPPPP